MTLQNPNSKSKRILTTMNCPHCGAHCLPENYAAHLKKIHPDVVETDRIWAQILKNSSPAGHSWVRKKTKKSRNNKTLPNLLIFRRCPVCRGVVEDSKLEAHQLSHKYNAPFSSKFEVHCPFCKLNTEKDWLFKHIFYVHPEVSDQSILELVNDFFIFPGINDEKKFLCQICGESIESKEFSKHILKHKHTQFIPDKNLVRCPICSILIPLDSLKPHINNKHLGVDRKQTNRIVQHVIYYDHQGFADSHIEKTVAGDVIVSSKGWVKCPICSNIIKLEKFESHYNSNHKIR